MSRTVACHGNFFDPAYAAILARPDWMRRFDKVHAQAARSLPKPQSDTDQALARARLHHEFRCAADERLLHARRCGVPGNPGHARRRLRSASRFSAGRPVFRLPTVASTAPRSIMRLGSLLVEAKLTEADFQSRSAAIVESYRDFDEVFDRERLPRTEIPITRWMRASEFPENASQELESLVGDPALFSALDPAFRHPAKRVTPAISSSAMCWLRMPRAQASASSTTSAVPTCAKSGSR